MMARERSGRPAEAPRASCEARNADQYSNDKANVTWRRLRAGALQRDDAQVVVASVRELQRDVAVHGVRVRLGHAVNLPRQVLHLDTSTHAMQLADDGAKSTEGEVITPYSACHHAVELGRCPLVLDHLDVAHVTTGVADRDVVMVPCEPVEHRHFQRLGITSAAFALKLVGERQVLAAASVLAIGLVHVAFFRAEKCAEASERARRARRQ